MLRIAEWAAHKWKKFVKKKKRERLESQEQAELTATQGDEEAGTTTPLLAKSPTGFGSFFKFGSN